ncbi:KGGVGR-motif variant AAA ATPase [Methylobacterium tarhaniae]|uniref:KGGVGR-motif variant AAA ATPase n=1 Tax=Methylobacterium tarhaniae TaxID=1187852 RepID=UPI00142E4661|nr:division plane positioning ATPase MipZ [Methylobacterium tarhaniae]
MNENLLKIGPYVETDGPTITLEETFDKTLENIETYSKYLLKISLEQKMFIYLLDRRIVGADWLTVPRVDSIAGDIPILVFASLKGGVGRSTALSIVAKTLSDEGLRVLAIDLDLEAPGLGSLLLEEENRPEYGSLDYFVEKGDSAFTEADFATLMEASSIVSGISPVYVVPAFGTKSLLNPENVIAKLSRAYLEDISSDGVGHTFLERTRTLVTGLLAVRTFDVVLIDARAGLHETLAAPLLGLGADIFFFGVNQRQTFEGYLPLMKHLADITRFMPNYLLKIRMVHGKANLTDKDDLKLYRDRAHKLFSESLYGRPELSAIEYQEGEPSWYGVDDEDGPHFPWVITESEGYRSFDPLSAMDQLDPTAYREAFGGFVDRVRDLVVQSLEKVEADDGAV